MLVSLCRFLGNRMSRLATANPGFWKRNRWLPDLPLAIIAILGAIAAGIKSCIDLGMHADLAKRADQAPPNDWGVWLSWMAALFIAIHYAFKLVAAHRDGKAAIDNEKPDALFGACCVLRAAILKDFGLDNSIDIVRVCVYRVCVRRNGKASELERVTPYSCGGQPDLKLRGTLIPTTYGVVGRAARTGDPWIYNRSAENIVDHWKHMVDDFGYDLADAKTLNHTRWSYLAIPLKDGSGRVDSVVYIDSSEKNLFTDESVSNRVAGLCEGVTHFIDSRWS